MSSQDGEHLCNVSIGIKTQIVNVRAPIRKYDVKGRDIKRALASLGK